MSATDEIVETLKNADNESTSAPYWLIIDPLRLGLYWRDGDETIFAALDDENCERIGESVPNCIVGPFFSRETAAAHLKARRYEFSESVYVYCCSGYWSNQYKKFCREIGVGT